MLRRVDVRHDDVRDDSRSHPDRRLPVHPLDDARGIGSFEAADRRSEHAGTGAVSAIGDLIAGEKSLDRSIRTSTVQRVAEHEDVAARAATTDRSSVDVPRPSESQRSNHASRSPLSSTRPQQGWRTQVPRRLGGGLDPLGRGAFPMIAAWWPPPTSEGNSATRSPTRNDERYRIEPAVPGEEPARLLAPRTASLWRLGVLYRGSGGGRS